LDDPIATDQTPQRRMTASTTTVCSVAARNAANRHVWVLRRQPAQAKPIPAGRAPNSKTPILDLASQPRNTGRATASISAFDRNFLTATWYDADFRPLLDFIDSQRRQLSAFILKNWQRSMINAFRDGIKGDVFQAA
jgi:hypothetical protein